MNQHQFKDPNELLYAENDMLLKLMDKREL